jgi:hypothetical protein
MYKRKAEQEDERPAKRQHLEDAPCLSFDILLEIFSRLPLPQIFCLHSLCKDVNSQLKSSSTFWKDLVLREEKNRECNEDWNSVIDYACDAEKFEEGKAPYVSATGEFTWGHRPTQEENKKHLEGASIERLRLIVQSWAIHSLWKENIEPLYYPDLSANGEPIFSPFYISPEAGNKFFEQLNAVIKDNCAWGETEPTERSLEAFYDETMGRIAELLGEAKEEASDEEDEEGEEGEEGEGKDTGEGEKAKKKKEIDIDACNFPKGTAALWKKFPEFMWRDTRWPFVEWSAGEIGPWENAYKFFWGTREDNSVVGMITIVDNS